jgi:PilZ domain
MERRRHKRIYVHLKASITVDDQTYDGYIENISESGIGYLMSSPARFKDDFLSTKRIELNFQMGPGKAIVLDCVATWSKKGLGSSKIIGVGMKIIDPPLDYGDWVRSLHVKL